ncbi:MAG: TPM domain-containing protein [Oscillospiraceae bacterium]|nr:TPM domain-containing protein [Oscillospiraceae bacterium]
MKKRIFALIVSLAMLISMAAPSFAAAEDVPFSTMVLDQAGILAQNEVQELDNRAWEITHTYECAVYIATTDSMTGMNAPAYTQYLHEKYGMGYGSDQSCVILMVSTGEREYNIMAHGYGNTAFTDYGKEKMAEQFIDELANDDWYTAFSNYLDCCDEYLELARNGEPYDKGSDKSPFLGILLGVLAPMIVAFFVCAKFKAEMQTANIQIEAKNYIDLRGLALKTKEDQFIQTSRTQRYVKPKEESGGTTTNSSGSSHSGGKF